ncbi:MAG: hypothetical protein ABIG96_02865 [Candidatus Micrarchaeota archaeon]
MENIEVWLVAGLFILIAILVLIGFITIVLFLLTNVRFKLYLIKKNKKKYEYLYGKLIFMNPLRMYRFLYNEIDGSDEELTKYRVKLRLLIKKILLIFLLAISLFGILYLILEVIK